MESVIPYRRLPKGFLRMLDDPPDPPAFPRPSATLVLLRRSPAGSPRSGKLEVLLLKRSPRSGFIPGAWVFPGGTVDGEDGAPRLLTYLDGLSAEGALERLRRGNSTTHPLEKGTPGPQSEPPAWAYWVAAIRETFEETGVLLRKRPVGSSPGEPEDNEHGNDQLGDDAIAAARSRLLHGKEGFREILDGLGLFLDAGALEYCGHWLTPECEPRRYETRFFVTEIGPEIRITPHEKEMEDALWITPDQALARNREGSFPLVFPTLHTLEELRRFSTPGQALKSMRDRPVPRRLPKPERAEGGVRFMLAE